MRYGDIVSVPTDGSTDRYVVINVFNDVVLLLQKEGTVKTVFKNVSDCLREHALEFDDE